MNSLTTSYTINELLNYSKSFDVHSVEVLLGHENYDYTYNYFRGFRQGQIVDGNTELVNFTTTNHLPLIQTSTGLKVISPDLITTSMRSISFQVHTVVMVLRSFIRIHAGVTSGQ